MSALSEAIERAEKRLDTMTQEQREKYYHIILSEELRRVIPASEKRPGA